MPMEDATAPRHSGDKTQESAGRDGQKNTMFTQVQPASPWADKILANNPVRTPFILNAWIRLQKMRAKFSIVTELRLLMKDKECK